MVNHNKLKDSPFTNFYSTIGIILILIGTTIFMNGYHSIDLVHNYPIAQYDKTLSGKILDIDTIYSNGIFQIYLGMIINMLGVKYGFHKLHDSRTE